MQLWYPHLMNVIGASLETTHEVTLHYEVINNEEKVTVLEGTGIFLTDLKCRLLSPQDNFMEIKRLKNPELSFTVTWYRYLLKLFDQVSIGVFCEKNMTIC